MNRYVGMVRISPIAMRVIFYADDDEQAEKQFKAKINEVISDHTSTRCIRRCDT